MRRSFSTGGVTTSREDSQTLQPSNRVCTSLCCLSSRACTCVCSSSLPCTGVSERLRLCRSAFRWSSRGVSCRRFRSRRTPPPCPLLYLLFLPLLLSLMTRSFSLRSTSSMWLLSSSAARFMRWLLGKRVMPYIFLSCVSRLQSQWWWPSLRQYLQLTHSPSPAALAPSSTSIGVVAAPTPMLASCPGDAPIIAAAVSSLRTLSMASSRVTSLLMIFSLIGSL
mmetsp:Transcript_41958/g.119001  ORF Transcript_41958/g.119001 Transcript_41958/m.119001 type:complete len:223 (+) Transcript_41958:927-1595(+)